MKREQRAAAFERFDEAIEAPMLVLALLFVPVIVVPNVVTLSPAVDRVFETVNWLIWAVFAAELTVKVYLAPRRWHFLATH